MKLSPSWQRKKRLIIQIFLEKILLEDKDQSQDKNQTEDKNNDKVKEIIKKNCVLINDIYNFMDLISQIEPNDVNEAPTN